MKIRLRRIRRLLSTDRNPLRRRIDRVEAAIMLTLVVLFLVAAPLLGFVAGRLAGASARAELQAERGWREVPAVLLSNGANGISGMSGDGNVAWVPARWTAPSGARKSGVIAVGLSARKGQRVPVWVTPGGTLTPAKAAAGDVSYRVAMGVVLALGSLAILLSAVAGGMRAAANRRRMASWTTAWAATGPRWSSFR